MTIERMPGVRWEPCARFLPDADCPWCSCTECGWLEDDHAPTVAGVGSLPAPAALVRAS